MPRYETPNRPRSPATVAALAWWRSLADWKRLELRRRKGLTSQAKIAAHYAASNGIDRNPS